MTWTAHADAERYDVVKGDLMNLRSTGGDFTSSLTGCLENDSMDTQSSDPANPGMGEGSYYLVRAQADCRNGTWNCGHQSQLGDRDSEIEESINKCP